MKCTICGAWTEVRQTVQQDKNTTVRRRRYCANNHPFTTYEIDAAKWKKLIGSYQLLARFIGEFTELDA